jgi:hypothetical protein
MSKRAQLLSWQSIALVIALALPTLYVAGYPLLGPDDPSTPAMIDRSFPSLALTQLYVPMGVVESQLRGATIGLRCADPVNPFDIYIGP